MAALYFLQTPHDPPSFEQCLQDLQFLQALKDFVPVQVANAVSPQQLSAVTCGWNIAAVPMIATKDRTTVESLWFLIGWFLSSGEYVKWKILSMSQCRSTPLDYAQRANSRH